MFKSAISITVIVERNGIGDLSSNQDKAVCISHFAHAHWKDMNPFVPPPSDGYIIRQIGFFSIDKTNSQEGKL